MFNPSKNEVRLFFIQTWEKVKNNQVLTPAESVAAYWIKCHPEFHETLNNNENILEKNYSPEEGNTNPFLHLSLHLAVSEQVSIDQPPGIKQVFLSLCERYQCEHEACHKIFDCLTEQIWQQQRNQIGFNNESYLNCIQNNLL